MASVSESIRQNNNSRCRICMFPKPNLSSLFRRGLSMKVMKLAEIKMYEGDGLPPSICLDCEVEVNRSVNFIGQIQRADAKLREMLENGTGVYESVKELGEQEASTSQIDIEEFNVKQEMILDNLLDEKTDVNCQSDNDHFDASLENNDHPEEEAELNPLDHVDVVEDRSRSDTIEVPVDPLGQEEPLIESQKIDSDPTADPLICLKQEAISMDVDKDSPEPCGSSSTDSGSLALGVSITPELHRKRSFLTPVIEENNKFKTQIDQQTDFTQVLEQNVLPQSAILSVHDHFLNLRPNEGLEFSSNDEYSASVTKNYNFQQTEEISPCPIKIGKPFSVAKKGVKDFSLPSGENYGNVENNLSCFVCNINFSSFELLQEHKTEDKFICRVCTKVFFCHAELETHAFSHKIYKCQVCFHQFVYKGDLLKHKQIHNITKYQCEYCIKTFARLRRLRQHKAEIHEGNVNNYNCIVCGKGFGVLKLLKYHQIQCHVPYEHVKCNLCSRVYFGPDNLKLHIKQKHLCSEGNAPVRCRKCGKVLASSHSLLKHMETHDAAEVVCEICGKTAKNKSAMRRHMTFYHSGKIKKTCEKCNEQFDDLHMYTNHRRHHKYHFHNNLYC